MDNVRGFPDINQIKDEAANWVVRLHGQSYKTEHEVPAALASELRLWIEQSDLHRDCFLTALSAWDAMGMLEELAEIVPLAEEPATANASWPWWGGSVLAGLGRRSFVLPSATALAALFLVWMMALLPGAPIQAPAYATQVGEQATYTLKDGSKLMLNTNSEVKVAFGEDRRVITLLRGEANFDVAKDPSRPFMVYAGEGMVWAVGTAFNVGFRAGMVDVVVSEGRVKVFSGLAPDDESPPLRVDLSNPASSGLDPAGGVDTAEPWREVLLGERDAVQYAEVIVSKQSLEQQSLERKLAWQSGALIFEGETLKEALEEISRYTDLQLVIADPAIAEARVGGRFRTADIDELLASLAKGLNLKTKKGDGNRVLFLAK